MCRRDVPHGHHAVACPAWLADGVPDDEVFTSSTGAMRGGGRAWWGDEILIGTMGRW
jgi:hypothetical protein